MTHCTCTVCGRWGETTHLTALVWPGQPKGPMAPGSEETWAFQWGCHARCT